jgi:hypothetical protein
MKLSQFIRELSNYQQDREIEIECPNGLMVDPRIKIGRINPYNDGFGPVESYVISWRD